LAEPRHMSDWTTGGQKSTLPID